MAARTVEDIEALLVQLGEGGDQPVVRMEGDWICLRELLFYLGSDDPSLSLRALNKAWPPLKRVTGQRRFPPEKKLQSALHKNHVPELLRAFAKTEGALGPFHPPEKEAERAEKRKRRELQKKKPKRDKRPQLELCPATPPRDLPSPTEPDPFAPYGWGWVQTSTGRELSSYQPEAQWVVYIVVAMGSIKDAKKVARQLNLLGAKMRGKPWTADDVRQVIEWEEEINGRWRGGE